MNYKTFFSVVVLYFLSNSLISQNHKMFTNGRLILGTYQERTASISSGDIDGDGDNDILVANGRHWPGQNRIFINNGRGIFTVEKNLGLNKSTTYATEIADLDNDGDLDIAVGNDMAPNYIFLNDGKGNFTKGAAFGEDYAPTRNLTLADLDKDGDVDILIINRGKTNQICLNNGDGTFTKTFNFGTQKDSTIDVEVADMDNDNDLDLILANRDLQQNYVYLNNGNLEFKDKIPFGTGKDNTRSLNVADINKDGILDIITANIGEQNVIYFGSKKKEFSTSLVFDTSLMNSYSLSTADIDSDNDIDIIVGNYGKPNTIFYNSNNGQSWTKKDLSKEALNTYDIITSDINNDKLIDIIEANSDGINRYYLNRILSISETKEQILQKEQKEILAGLTGKTSIKNNKPINDRYSQKNRTIARDFLGNWIQKLKLNLEEHPYKIDITRKGVTKNYVGENIYTVIPATTKSDEYIIIGAHFDSVRNCPGANDNATGCALVYGIAKQIANLKTRKKNVLVAYFDQEELGLVGSQAFTKFIKEKKLNVHSVHTVDQMGWDNDKDRNIEIEIPTPFLKSIYQKHAKKLGVSAFVTPEAGSDHRAFRNGGYNAVGITEEYRNKDTTPHYHKNTDTYETINFEYLSFSTNLVYNVIKELVSK